MTAPPTAAPAGTAPDDATLPGFRVVAARSAEPVEELRNDVAGFLGPTARGPLGVPVRVSGPEQLGAVLGGTGPTVRAVRAYFANGGQVAWVVRCGAGGAPARATVPLGTAADGRWADDTGPVRLGLPGTVLELAASSPGTWADGLRVELTYRAYGLTGAAELDVALLPGGEAPVFRAGIAPADLVAVLERTGMLHVRLTGPPAAADPGPAHRGRATITWSETLVGGGDPAVTVAAHLEASAALRDVGEVALVAAPGLADYLEAGEDEQVVAVLAADAADAQDRLVVLAAPDGTPAELAAWTARMRAVVAEPGRRRAVACWFPALLAETADPAAVERYVPISPVGHVCGVIARLDRERGSGWSPANELVRDAVDVTRRTDRAEQAHALDLQVNLLRPRIGGGLETWGARTLDPGDGTFVAHRRLVHRLVRAIRQVTEPLVFETNGPVLWFAVVRAITGVLLEAFRSGALQGAAPNEAFRVRCDETTHTADDLDLGRVVCQVEVAPTAPMEFITLRVTLGPQDLLEVVEQGAPR